MLLRVQRLVAVLRWEVKTACSVFFYSISPVQGVLQNMCFYLSSSL